MATDLIEENQLAALDTNRTNAGFVDDDNYMNITAKEVEVLNDTEVANMRKKFPDPKSCEEVLQVIERIDLFSDALEKARITAKKAADKHKINAQSRAADIRKVEIQEISQILKCDIQFAAQKKAAEQQDLQTALSATAKAKTSSNINDYILYGVLALAVVGTIVIIVRKKKS